VHPCTGTEALYRSYDLRGGRGIALLYRHCGSVQAVRPYGGRGLALLFLDRGTRR